LIKSMTGYGQGDCALGEMKFAAEVKSVNYRYRDVVIRLPKTLQAVEDEMRGQVASKFRRGRIEVMLQIEKGTEETPADLELNLPLVRSYQAIFQQLKEGFGVEGKVRPHEFCQMKDVVLVKPEEMDMDKVRQGLKEALRLALDSCDRMKIQEGKALEEDFLKRVSLVEGHLKDIEQRAPLVVEEYKGRLKDKISQIAPDVELDENRIRQEVVIFADKCDITEEIVRTRSHLGQFRHYLSVDDAVGRRLDFLLQEIHREINTMSAKASDSSISAKVVEVKAELEKLREQAQNVE
jgi:uncharacterized protein (TIGR00255 family)